MALSREGILFADQWNITLCPCYLPGIANIEADVLSRNKQVIEWCLHPNTAAKLFLAWGRPEVDLFAFADNALLPIFFFINSHSS